MTVLGVKRSIRRSSDDELDGGDDEIILDKSAAVAEEDDRRNVLHIEKKQKKIDKSNTTTTTTTTTSSSASSSTIQDFLKQNNIVTVNLKKSTGENISLAFDLRDQYDDDDDDDGHHYNKNNNNRKTIGSLLKRPLADLEKELLDQEFLPVKRYTSSNNINNGQLSKEMTKLWVDKYAPTSFHDLISDDKMNKDILFWLKQWDQLVFHKKIPKSATNNSTGNNPHFFRKNNTSTLGNLDDNDDGSHGPYNKVILLTGGPGIGKTTLAKILAKHAGYDVAEINASDDRSGEEFDNFFWGALETQSVFGKVLVSKNDDTEVKSKPKCLVIDEIDGISGRENGPIDMILNLIANDRKSRKAKSNSNSGDIDDQDDDDDDGDGDNEGRSKPTVKSSSSKKKEYPRINRPIICICNDQFATSLKKLRHEVLIFNFAKPKQTKLLGRLKEICELENLQADDATLTMLMEKTNYDIRSCLNHLQLFKTNKKGGNSYRDRGDIIGQKDIETGLMDTVKNIFTTAKTMPTINGNSIHKKNQSNEHQQAKFMEQLDEDIQSSTQLDKLIDAAYENFPINMKNDFNFEKSIECLEWFSYSDIMYDEKFKSLAPLAVHTLCHNTLPKVNFPQSDYQCYLKQQQTIHTIDSFIGTDSTSAYKFSTLSRRTIITDFISPFIDIVSVPVRSANPQLYNPKEKATLNQLIQTMRYFNINYKLDPINDTLKLNPPIDTLTHYYDGKDKIKIKGRIELTKNQKQIIQTSFSQLKFTQIKGSENGNSKQQEETPIDKEKDKFKVPSSVSLPKPLPTTDMFGRKIHNSPNEKGKESKTIHTIRYKYQDGFTNAVKKVTCMKEFM